MTIADEIRAAAEILRCSAQAAGGEAWAADHFEQGTIVRPANSTHSLLRLAADGPRAAGTPHVAKPVGAYMALVDPATGLDLADWLESAARDARKIGPDPHALAVARAITGAQP